MRISIRGGLGPVRVSIPLSGGRRRRSSGRTGGSSGGSSSPSPAQARQRALAAVTTMLQVAAQLDAPAPVMDTFTEAHCDRIVRLLRAEGASPAAPIWLRAWTSAYGGTVQSLLDAESHAKRQLRQIRKAHKPNRKAQVKRAEAQAKIAEAEARAAEQRADAAGPRPPVTR